MSVPTFVASADANLATAGTGPLTCNKPTGTANGDLLLWHVAVASGAGVPTTPSGWELLWADAVTNARGYLYGRIASSEPATYDVSVSIASEYTSNIHAYRPSAGAWASVADAIASVIGVCSASSSAPPVPALPIVTGDYVLVAFMGHGRGSTTTTQPTGYTLAGNPDSGGTGSSAVESAGAYKSVTAGSAPATTFTTTNGATSSAVHIAIADPGTVRRAIRSVRATAFATAGSYALPMPRVVKAGDRLVAVMTRTGIIALTPPTGWTQKVDHNYNAGGSPDTVGVYEKVADGTEPGTTPTFTALSGTAGCAAWVWAYRDSGPIVYATVTDSSADLTVDIPALTMAAQTPGAVIVALASESRGDHLPNAAPSGYTVIQSETATAVPSLGTGGASGDSRSGASFLVTTGANPAATTYSHDSASVAAGVHIGTTDASGGTPGGSGFYSYMTD